MTTTGHHHNSSCVSVKDFPTHSASRHRFQLISALTDTFTTLFIASCMQVGTSEVPSCIIFRSPLSLHSHWQQPPWVYHFTLASSFVPGMCRMFLVRNGAHLERRVQCTWAGWKKEALEMKACGLAWAVVSVPDSRLVCLCCLKCCRCGCGYEPNRRSDKVSSILP